ncbi:MAG: hypothetical protein ACPLN0_00725 [Candidatus Hydrothermia bacterium]
MEVSVIVLREKSKVELYKFLDGILSRLLIFNLEEIDQRKEILGEILDSRRVYVLLDDQETYYQDILTFPLLKGSELKRTILYELISTLGEKARFSFDTVGIKEDEAGISSLVQVIGIKESFFQYLLESFKKFKDLIELIIPYPISYSNFDQGPGVLILETYEDKTKLSIIHQGVVYLHRSLAIGSSNTSKEDYIARLNDEIDRITYYMRQNYDRYFEVRKLLYFSEKKDFTLVFESLRFPKENIQISNYRGGLLAPYILLNIDPKKFSLNILPPVVTYREVSPYIFLFLSLSFLVFTSLFTLSAIKLKKYESTLQHAMEDSRSRLHEDITFVKSNKVYLLTAGISRYQFPQSDLLKLLSMSTPEHVRISYLKTQWSPSGIYFSMELYFDGVPNFKREDLVKEFLNNLNSTGRFKNLNYTRSTREKEYSFNITGILNVKE